MDGLPETHFCHVMDQIKVNACDARQKDTLLAGRENEIYPTFKQKIIRTDKFYV